MGYARHGGQHRPADASSADALRSEETARHSPCGSVRHGLRANSNACDAVNIFRQARQMRDAWRRERYSRLSDRS